MPLKYINTTPYALALVCMCVWLNMKAYYVLDFFPADYGP